MAVVANTTRDILDPNGNVIGTLSLPADTDDGIWADRLAVYSTPTPAPDPRATLVNSILAAMDFGRNLLADFSAGNTLSGLTSDQLLVLANNAPLSNIINLLTTGSLPLAVIQLQALSPISDNNGNVLLTQDTINNYIMKINTYLG